MCTILPQISGYIKYFDYSGKNISFKIEDDNAFLKHNEIWNKIKKTLNINFHRQPLYDEKYRKTKVTAFNDVINTAFSDNEVLKEKDNYTCIAAINIDFVAKIDKKLFSSLSRTVRI